ncbi:MAG: hypothetical protein ACLSTO_00500 [Bilophila wadsworthia]
MKTFIKRRSAFFHIDPVLGNPRLEDAASRVLPDGLALARAAGVHAAPVRERVRSWRGC